MLRSLLSKKPNFYRSFHIKYHRNRVNRCGHIGPLRDFYYDLFKSNYAEICKLFSISGFPFIENAILSTQPGTLNLDIAYNRLLNKIASLSKITDKIPEQFNSPRELLALSNCINIIATERNIPKEQIMPAYKILVEKSPVLSLEEVRRVHNNIHEAYKKTPDFDFLKNVGAISVTTVNDLFTKYTRNFRKTLNLVDPSGKVNLTNMDADGDTLIISRDNFCDIILTEYEEHSGPSVSQGVDMINEEKPHILALPGQPKSEWPNGQLIEKTMEEHIEWLKRQKNQKEVIESAQMVYENHYGLSEISFNDTLVYQFLKLMRKENPNQKALMSCLFYNMNDQDELHYLASNIDIKKSEELFEISKYHRLTEALIWLDTVKKKLCPQCGDKIDYAPDININLMSEGDFNGEFLRISAVTNLISRIKEERKNTKKNIKVIMFCEHQQFPLLAKTIFNSLCDYNNPNLGKEIIPTKNWDDLLKNEAELRKIAQLATSFRLYQ